MADALGERLMTVCIAAICSWPDGGLLIVGASDRMLSAHDIKFEPPQKKIYGFHEKAIALTAGDPYAQIAINDEVSRVLALRPRKTIAEIAEQYAEAFSAYRRRAAEAKFLKPLGLDANSFMDRSQDFRSDLVSDLRLDMQRCSLDVETIIAGVDDTGPHLFVITDPGVVSCADSVAFAAIGSGKTHADSHFMMSHHTRRTDSNAALVNTYIAKRRAEVTPSVGGATDMFFMGDEGYRELASDVQDAMSKQYDALEAKIAAATAAAISETSAFIASRRTNETPKEDAKLPKPATARRRQKKGEA